jgi:hypothetical protein
MQPYFQDLRRSFLILLAVSLIFRCWLGAVFPITGDEAYFIWWGQYPDWGFYDHPPMIGWWLAVLLQVSNAEWWLRLPVILQPGLLALAVAAVLKKFGDHVAWGAAILVLLAPVNVWNVFITTDTPLVYFSVVSGLAWLLARRAETDGSKPWGWYLLAGLGLLGAVLSKYFVVLLGLAFLLDTLYKPSRQKVGGLLLTLGLTLPGLALMVWWNASHCWGNVMFNVYNRHGDAGWSVKTPLIYIGMLLYMLTPLFFWQLSRRFLVIKTSLQHGETRALLLVGVIPFVMFGVLSLVSQIGLHWVLSFVPFALMLLAVCVEADRLRRAVRFFAVFAALHVLVVAAGSQVPLENWRKHPLYEGMVLTFEAKQLIKRLEPYPEFTWMMDNYSHAVTLGYNTFATSSDGRPHYMGVFGEASSHARHDDILTDFTALDGRNIAILRETEPKPGAYDRFFTSVEVQNIEWRGATFHLILGRGFKYGAYRDDILATVRQKYYALPAWLPQTACYYCDRYFPEQPCIR